MTPEEIKAKVQDAHRKAMASNVMWSSSGSGVRDLLRGEDDGILWTFFGLAGLGTFGLLGSDLLAGFTAAAGPAASRKDEGQRHGRQRPLDVLRH